MFGRLRCGTPDERGEDACKVGVFSSAGARDGSDTAQVIRDALRGCSHDRETVDPESELDPDVAATEAKVRLARLRNLLTSASALLAEAEQHREIDRLLAEVTTPPREPTEADEAQLRALEDRAARDQGKGLAMGTAAGVVPWPPDEGCAEVLRIAEAVKTQVTALISRAEGHEDHGSLHTEANWLSDQLSLLLQVAP